MALFLFTPTATVSAPQEITEMDKIKIDLSGPEGNAFVLLGYAKKMAKDLDLDYAAIRNEMMSSNYDNLLIVFEKHFGEFVELVKG